jgi:hypothetical protein
VGDAPVRDERVTLVEREYGEGRKTGWFERGYLAPNIRPESFNPRKPWAPEMPGFWPWFVRHGLWIGLFVLVTLWELGGFVFPVTSTTPKWWYHPTISQEVKHLVGTSLAGRVITIVLLTLTYATLILHFAIQVF